MRTQRRELARKAINDCLLLFFEYEVHLCGSYWARMTHRRAQRVHV
jgi:hypothetical protein